MLRDKSPPEAKTVREEICIVTPEFPVLGGMRTNLMTLLRLLSDEAEPVVLARKWGDAGYRQYDLGLSARFRGWFAPWSLASLPFFELSGFLWCLLLRLHGVRKFVAQDTILSGFFTSLACHLTGGSLYLFDHGSAFNLDSGLLERELNQGQPSAVTRLQLRLMRLFRWFSIRSCRVFFVHSTAMREIALSTGLQVQRIVNYDFPQDSAVFSPLNSVRRRELRTKLGVKDSFCILYAGRLTLDKGLPLLLEAFRELSKENPRKMRLLLLGSGPLEQSLRTNVEEWGQGEVVFLGSVDDPKRVAEWMQAADVFVYPIVMSGGIAMAVLEAMASALPVVVGAAGPTHEVIRDGQNGFVMADPEAGCIAEPVRRLYLHSALRSKVGRLARGTVTERFSIERFGETVVARILEV